MRMRLQSNWKTVAHRFRRRGPATQEALKAAAREGARVLQEEAVAAMDELIYSIPEKVDASGKKRWVRTGKLKGEEKGRAVGTAIVLVNRRPYARHRHDRKDLVAPQREAPWREVALARARSRILQIRRRHVFGALRRP